jgi:large subunit ribosomal protein L6
MVHKIAIARRSVKIPSGVTAKVDGDKLSVQGPKGTLERKFAAAGVDLNIEDGNIVVSSEFPRRREKALTGTFEAHAANMVRGVTDGFQYTLKVVYNHFPIKAKVDGNKFLIENFLGERHPRRAAILPNVKVQVKGDQVVVSGPDKENVGQTAANIERATKVKKRDIRVFQDGIYLVSKEA